MSPEDIRKILIVVCCFLIIFLAFFFLFWRPRFADLRTYQRDLSEKQAELTKLERDAADWPDSITRTRLGRYEEELEHLLQLIPHEEEVSSLLKEIQDYARGSDLEILSLIRTATSKKSESAAAAEKKPTYIRVPYKISLGGNYHGVIKFLQKLEDSQRLVTITSTKIYVEQIGASISAEVQFNIFYSRAGVGTG